MEPTKVYFTNLRTNPSLNLQKKLVLLIKKAGIDNIHFDKKLTAIKIHFGEPGNLAYLRPNFAATIVKYVLQKGGKPFLTDSNTLYSGARSNAVDHLKAASENGYNPLVTNCPVIIADGLRGADYKEIKIDQEICKTAKIGKAIADADILISMNHFKGHELTGFGGALKNIGMGSASVGGKLELHSSSSPTIQENNCTGCRICEKNRAHDAITVGKDNIAHIDYYKCIGCGQCVAVCQYDAASVVWQGAAELVGKKIAEYSFAALKDKPNFHINFILDVSPDCDCWHYNDYPIVPNLGIAASIDPVALDQACADMVKKAPALPGSKICDSHAHDTLEGKDKFRLAHPSSLWEDGLTHAEKIGLGTRNYEIVNLDV